MAGTFVGDSGAVELKCDWCGRRLGIISWTKFTHEFGLQYYDPDTRSIKLLLFCSKKHKKKYMRLPSNSDAANGVEYSAAQISAVDGSADQWDVK